MCVCAFLYFVQVMTCDQFLILSPWGRFCWVFALFALFSFFLFAHFCCRSFCFWLCQDFGLYLLLWWTLWVLVAAVALCRNATSAVSGDAELRIFFQNLKTRCCVYPIRRPPANFCGGVKRVKQSNTDARTTKNTYFVYVRGFYFFVFSI